MHRNSSPAGWFSTFAIAILSFLFLLSFTAGFAIISHDWLHHGFELWVLFLACIAITTGYVWRSSRTVQFHTCYWSGISVLGGTLILALRMMEASDLGNRGLELQAVVCFLSIASAFGLILLMTALCIDRPGPRAK